MPYTNATPLQRHQATDPARNSYTRLVDSYTRTLQPIEVDFRALTPWIGSPDYATHQLHPYPGKLLLQIVTFFTRALFPVLSSGPILDPFSGSGTVALEASLIGHKTLVCDANPFASILAAAKTTNYNPDRLYHCLNLIVEHPAIKTPPDIPVVNDHLWYTAQKKHQLNQLKYSIDAVLPNEYLPFFYICFSLAARRLSFADPSISVPVRLKERSTFSVQRNALVRQHLNRISEATATGEFQTICQNNIARVVAANAIRPNRATAESAGSDARALKATGDPRANALPSKTIPLILTSPPYGSAQKYIRSTSLALNWLGLTHPKHLSTLEQRNIGREHLPAWAPKTACPTLSDRFQNAIERIDEISPHRANITRTYFAEMQDALNESARVLAPEGRLALIIGNNSVCGEIVRNDIFSIEALERCGLELELHLVNDIRARGLMTKRNRTAALITQEHALVFKKPRST